MNKKQLVNEIYTIAKLTMKDSNSLLPGEL